MAFQRPFLISLKKNDSQQPWGFRIFGGKDYDEPHVVQKVALDGVAERCGLREGDEIIQIGRINVQDLTFGQVQELIARCGNRIEMFVIREDLLAPRKGKEPPTVKAVVHNPYNSPLTLYSTENIADTLAKQTEVLTEGRISSPDEEEGPENLTFKQKSAVFQLLEEQAKQDTIQQNYTRGSPQRKVVPPPPPPKPKPPAPVYNKEEPTSPGIQRHTTTAVITPTRVFPTQHSTEADYFSSPVVKQQPPVSYATTVQSQPTPVANHYPSHSVAPATVTFKIGPPPPPRGSSQAQTTMTTVQRQQQVYQTQYQYQQQQQQQQQYYQQEMDYPPSRQQEINYQQTRHQEINYQPSRQQEVTYQQSRQQEVNYYPYRQQEVSRPVPQYSSHPYQYQAPRGEEPRDETLFEPVSPPPITYKAPPAQKYQVNWPPQQPDQWKQTTPSPTPASPSLLRKQISSVWPPKQPTVKELPKTGFNPAVLREQASPMCTSPGTGKRLVWPPPKDEEMRSGRTTPQSPVGGRRIAWNPSPSPPSTRRSPFGSMSPANRRKEIAWPPPQPNGNKENLPRPSPKHGRKLGRFEDYVKQQASNSVPNTYRPPPGTQRVEYC